MRKFIAISFLFVFTVLQYGKILSYLYCELQVEISNDSTLKCDCEKILFDNSKSVPETPASAPHSHAQKDKLNEPFTANEEMFSADFDALNTSYFIEQIISLHSGYEKLPFHPPALVS